MPAQPHTGEGRLRSFRSRRLGALAVTTSLALLLAACSGDDQPDTAPAGQSAPAPQPVESSLAPPPSPADTSDVAAPANGIVRDTQAQLDVDDQAGQGRSIRVKEVQISNGTGFVAVYSAGGRLLGSGRFGITVRQLTVGLDRRVPRSSELLAILYADDGDRRFERSDPRIVDEDGDFQDDTFDYRLLR